MGFLSPVAGEGPATSMGSVEVPVSCSETEVNREGTPEGSHLREERTF